jgi:tRNA 5-methylaminomethyl-2-thiouridine biosynthesis bifunctional protein
MALDWKEGRPFSSHFDDVYFSKDSGLEETRHVFLQGNRLKERFASLSAGDSFCIGETGFGTGLNFLCTWQLFEQTAPADSSLDFFSVEKFPLSDDELRATLILWPELAAQTEPLSRCWLRRVPGWNRWSFSGGRIRLTLANCDVIEALPLLPAERVDAWFLDGFSPAKNPEMWSEDVLMNIARASRMNATLATYTSAGWVRRGLQQAGFEVERVSGFGSKREMVRGKLARETFPKSSVVNKTHRTALIVGGGIAGCAAAYALVQRGIAVTLIDSAPQLASAASGNSRGILHARFGISESPQHRFVIAAYGHALGMLDQLLPPDGKVRAECGLLQLACNEGESKRIGKMAEKVWPENLLQFVDSAKATQLAGVEMKFGGLLFPAAGWIVPSMLCASLVNDESITQLLGHEVETLVKTPQGWRIYGRNTQGSTWEAEADIVIVCCANSAKKISQFEHFPLTPVRGQITEVQQSQSSKDLRCVVCGDGYCAPAADGLHVIGATHGFDDESTDVRAADHADNLANLAEYAPGLIKALGEIDADNLTGRAAIRCSAPGSMPLVGEVQEGLYCSLAHGTRGLLTAGLTGELLAAQICGQFPPLPVSIIEALAPKSRMRNKG